MAAIGWSDLTHQNEPCGRDRTIKSDTQKCTTWHSSDGQIRCTKMSHVAFIGWQDPTDGKEPRGPYQMVRFNSPMGHMGSIVRQDPMNADETRGFHRTARSDT
jgi:hypothetical protein